MKLKVIAIGILVAFSLSGCQTSEQTAETGSQEPAAMESENKEVLPEEDAKLLIMVDDISYGEQIAKGFKKSYPEVEISVISGGTQEADETVRIEGPLGNGPDVFFMAHDRMAGCVEYGMMLPLDDEIVEEVKTQLVETALETAQIDGITYGLPVTTEAMALYYNKDIVGDVAAATFEEVFELQNSLGEEQHAFLMNIGDSYNAYAILSAAGFNLFGADGNNIDEPGIDSEAFEKGLEFVKRLKKLMPFSSEQLTSDFVDEQFISGKAAYVYDGPWKLDSYKKSGVNFGVAMLPTVAGNTLTPFGGVINAHVSAYTKYPDAASLLVKYMASAEGAGILYETRHKASALKENSSVAGLKDDKNTQMFAKQFEAARPMPNNSRINYYWEIVPGSIKAVFDEGKSPEEVKNWTSKEWNERVSSEYFGTSS